MSEPIYTTFEIGGNISKSLMDELIECLCNDLDNMGDVLDTDDIESFTFNGYFSCNGYADWGSCNETKKFCKKNNLPFRESNEAKDDMEATVTFWVPGMEDDEEVYTDANQRPVIISGTLKPLTNLYFDCVKNNTEGLTKNSENPVLKPIIDECLSEPQRALDIIELEIKSKFPPDVPDLPDFIIE